MASTVRTLRLTGAYFALAAMLMHALLPAGWMPSIAANGTAIVLCTIEGPVQIVLDEDGNPVEHGSGQTDDTRHAQACPFAASAPLAPPTATLAVAAPLSAHSGHPVVEQTRAAAFGARYLVPLAHAPPQLHA